MPFSDNIEYLMSHPGTVAVLVCQVGEPLILDLSLNDIRFSGVASWRNVLADALSMLDDSGETFISAIIGEHSILAETRDGQQCAVVYPTGHAASKVMRRMLRHAAGPKRTMRKVKARARYNDARALGVPAIEAVRYAVHRNLCLCIKWRWRTGLEVAVRRDAPAATPSE